MPFIVIGMLLFMFSIFILLGVSTEINVHSAYGKMWGFRLNALAILVLTMYKMYSIRNNIDRVDWFMFAMMVFAFLNGAFNERKHRLEFYELYEKEFGKD